LHLLTARPTRRDQIRSVTKGTPTPSAGGDRKALPQPDRTALTAHIYPAPDSWV
jgi:hypothetical protein